MPTFTYECSKCKRDFEVIQKVSDPELTLCVLTVTDGSTVTKCDGSVRRVIAGSGGFILKGGGWYKDGY
jgi:putative FmdB family regulatory protein